MSDNISIQRTISDGRDHESIERTAEIIDVQKLYNLYLMNQIIK